MTLLEMSVTYTASAEVLRQRIRELRLALRQQEDPEEGQRLRRRIADLTPLLQETREIAALTAHYYDRGCHRYAAYRI